MKIKFMIIIQKKILKLGVIQIRLKMKGLLMFLKVEVVASTFKIHRNLEEQVLQKKDLVIHLLGIDKLIEY